MTDKSISQDEKMNIREYLRAVLKVLRITFKLSPLAIVIKVFDGIFNSITPLVTAYFAGRTITAITEMFNGVVGAERQAIFFVILTALLGLISTLMSTGSYYINQVLRFRVESKVSDMLYEHFVRLPFWCYEDSETNDLYDRASDFFRFFAMAFDKVLYIFTALFGFISAVVALWFVSPWLTVIFTIAILPGFIIQYRLSRLNIEHWRSNAVARRKQYHIEANMMHPKIIPELRLYNLANKMLELRAQYRDKDEGDRLNYERRFIKWQMLGNILEALVELGTLIWAVVKIAGKALPVGQFVFIQQLASRAISSSSRFVSEYGSADEDLAKLKDYSDFMAIVLPEDSSLKVPNVINSIEFRNVDFSYPNNEKLVLEDISLTINKGDRIALVGENGAGKTTFIKLLLGFYEPRDGQILINGKPLSGFNIASWHKCISVLMQDFTNFDFLNIRDNVVFGDVGAKMTDQRIYKALDDAEATDIVSNLPVGLDTSLAPWLEKEDSVSLSGGQQQRLGLARNFYRQSPIVILDEPTSAIDALAEAKIFDKLYNEDSGRTLIAISHRLTTIESADIIYVFDRGKIVQQGRHKQLASQKDGQYARMFRRQLKNRR